MTHDSAGQAGIHQAGEIEITDEMVRVGVTALNDRLADARSQAILSEAGVAFALREILQARSKSQPVL
jgi:hypothetical protein